MTRHFCDRCGKEAELATLTLTGPRTPRQGEVLTLARVEVCARCVDQLTIEVGRALPQEAS